MGEPDRTFSFRNRVRPVRLGETLLAALSRDGPPLLRRSIQYHRPQGPFCGIGHCAGCLVRVNGRPNVRACRYEPAAGDIVTTENAWPSPSWDLFGAIGLLAPGGVDTLHGLRRPAWATRFYQRLVRRLAGTGAPPTDAAPLALGTPAIERSCDAIVVGAGGAGRAVADALVAAGIQPVVLERELNSPTVAGGELFAATTAVFLPPPSETEERRFTLLAFREPAQGVRLTTRSVVVATGGYDASLLFRGNDRPGVLTADAALSLATPTRPPPFARAVVVGGGHRAAEVLERCGEAVEAVVAPGEIRPEVVRAVADLGIPLYPRSLIVRTEGRNHVRAVWLRARGNGPGTRLACDAVVLAHRRVPNSPLFFQAGAAMDWKANVAAYFPKVGPSGATSVPGLFAAGSVAGVLPPAFTQHADAIAAAIVHGARPTEPPPSRPQDDVPTELLGYYRELLRVPGHGRWVACSCADVLVSEVEEAVRAGYRGIEVIKRRSSLGTGICQGRYCLPDALLLLSLLENRPPPEVGYITQRPPVVPTPLAAFASLSPGPAEKVEA
jgi:hypothetical protein